MAKRTVKVAILRARHDTAYQKISDWRCLQMLDHNAAGQAVFEFWRDVSGGYFAFSVGLMPWVDVDFSTLPVDPNTRTILRWDQMRMAYAATDPLVGNLHAYDVYLLLTYPGTSVALRTPVAGAPGTPSITTAGLDGGSWPDGDGKGRATLGVVPTTHATYCHEVGHTLGFGHSYGPAPKDYPTGVYGDAYDIMSGRTSRFSGVEVPGWPEPGRPLPDLMSCGPALSLAHLHFFEPASLDPALVHHITAPPVGKVVTRSLRAAWSSGPHFQLLVVHPAGEDEQGRGRMYVEFRTAIGWDAGIGGSTVVVHEIADSPDGVRCWYRSRVLLPLGPDTDVTIGTKPWSVRVLDEDDDPWSASVGVQVGVSSGAGIEIVPEHEVWDYDKVGSVRSLTPCDDEVEHGTWTTTSHSRFIARTFGYGGAKDPGPESVVISWSVAGTALTLKSPDWGVVVVPSATGTTSLEYLVDAAAGTLRLISGAAAVCTVHVTATATSAGGSGATSHTVIFEARGSRTGWADGDGLKVMNCLTRRLRGLLARGVALEDLLIPTSPFPDPAWHREIAQINIQRIEDLVREIASTDLGAADDLITLARLHYGGEL